MPTVSRYPSPCFCFHGLSSCLSFPGRSPKRVRLDDSHETERADGKLELQVQLGEDENEVEGLEEDEEFLAAAPAPALPSLEQVKDKERVKGNSHEQTNAKTMMDLDNEGGEQEEEELEEDESFLVAAPVPSPSVLTPLAMAGETSAAALAGNGDTRNNGREEEEELEEDPSFAVAPPATNTTHPSSPLPPSSFPASLSSSSTSSHPHSPSHISTNNTNNRSSPPLPSTSNLLYATTGKRQQIDVSNLDLGDSYAATRDLQGTSYAGRKVRFGRRKGNSAVGEVGWLFSNPILSCFLFHFSFLWIKKKIELG